jgi:hypothetical protein
MPLLKKGTEVNANSAKADAKFLRRILLALVFLTTVAGGMVGFTTVQATNSSPESCTLFCD